MCLMVWLCSTEPDHHAQVSAQIEMKVATYLEKRIDIQVTYIAKGGKGNDATPDVNSIFRFSYSSRLELPLTLLYTGLNSKQLRPNHIFAFIYRMTMILYCFVCD